MTIFKQDIIEKAQETSSKKGASLEDDKRLVIVKPIYKPAWHGNKNVSKLVDCKDTLRAQYDSETGAYRINIPVNERRSLEKLMGLNVGDLDTSFYSPFWTILKVKLGDKANLLDMSKPIERLQYYILLGHDLVANSVEELNAGLWPKARYVIFDEQKEVEAKAKSASHKAKAYEALQNMTPEKMRKVLLLLGDRPMKGASTDFLYGKLAQFVEDDAKKFNIVANKDPKRLEAEATVLDLRNAGILTQKGTAFSYNADQLGFDFNSTVDYLQDPENNQLYIQLKSYLEQKNK